MTNAYADKNTVNQPIHVQLKEPSYEDLLTRSNTQLVKAAGNLNTDIQPEEYIGKNKSYLTSQELLYSREICSDTSKNTSPSRNRIMERRAEVLLSPRTLNRNQNGNSKEIFVPIKSVSNPKKNLHDIFQELHIEPRKPRYRRRSLERRSALSTTHHPHFDLVLPQTQPAAHRPFATTIDESIGLSYSNTKPRIFLHEEQRIKDAVSSRQMYDSPDQGKGNEKKGITMKRTLSLNFMGGASTTSRNSRDSKTGKIYESVRRNSSLLTQHLICMFNHKNDNFDEFTSRPSHQHPNVLLETLKRNKSQNILNTIKKFEEDEI